VKQDEEHLPGTTLPQAYVPIISSFTRELFYAILHHLLDIHLLYTYIRYMQKTEWKSGEKMYQNHREFGRGERLTQYAIELFDLVDITPAATAEKTIDHRFLQTNVSIAAPRYGKLAMNSHRRKPVPEAYQKFIATGVGA
jgi:hypothetical protein